MEKIETDNELNLKVSGKDNKVLVNEDCCTTLTITLNNNGDIFTSFLGAYNNDIIKLLKKTQISYFKNLSKKLKNYVENENANSNEISNKPEKSEGKKVAEKKSTTKKVFDGAVEPKKELIAKPKTRTKKADALSVEDKVDNKNNEDKKIVR